ncbi:aspartate/glutamate racemase family protein [Planomicrobium sp. CPCC 101079]|uniref:aspartate/glutamate racemase family protein n=1 Tax=Planomicrobium sp. CPCC 101079 TaxID=2599618 RepID=UPI0011B773CF|nr:amino acid racemase [Planomicrobium sp. CPCC 101079]TWT04686.1 amino acid racemase [Planomicrobium sp. CPCC 101079]
MEKKILGIVGGVGPLATMFIGEMIVRRTNAASDQEHVHSIIFNNTGIPDRTAYIMDRSKENPVPVMISDIHKLVSLGAEMIIVPCNTAHSFHEELQNGSPVPVIHMIHETMKRAAIEGAERVGILATTGTVTSEIYQQAAEEFGLVAVLPNDKIQAKVMSIIYENVKAGKPADMRVWADIVAFMKSQSCDRIILGCTELSIIKKELDLPDFYLDSLMVLAETAILACGYKLAMQEEKIRFPVSN